jgi:uncharacterized protein involved in outer membrane biogenesis
MKRVLKIIGAVVALIVVVAIAIPFFISADYVKAQLQAQVKKATGRTLEIKGEASISVFPSIAIHVADVTFGNPAGFSSPYFVHIDKLAVGAALKPLLNKQLRVTGITLDGATLNVEETASGAKNWDFASSKKQATPAPQTAADKQAAGAPPLVIDTITLRNVAVNYRKAGPKPMKLEATNIASDIRLDGARATVKLGNASLYGGSAKGTVTRDGRTSAIALDMALDKVQIEPLMVALTGASKLEGAATVAFDVKGSGTTEPSLMRSLNGKGAIKITDGAVKGINIASFLRDAKKGFVLGDSSTESTDFTEMTASVTIAQGIASNSDLLMKSPILRLTGSGTINLPAHSINYRAVPSIVGTLKGQGGKDKLTAGGLDIPLLITGPWTAISVTPDVAGLLTNALENPEAVQQNIKDIGESIGKYNSPKDIGAALLGGKEEAAPTPATTTAAPAGEPAPAAKPAKDQLINDAIGGVLEGFGK